MKFSMDLINGVAIGMEYVPGCEEHENTIIVDLVIIRLLIQWS